MYLLPILFLIAAPLLGDEGPTVTAPTVTAPTLTVSRDESKETHHVIQLGGKELRYKATAGTLIYKNEKNEAKGEFFYTAYVKEENGSAGEEAAKRPIAFCFNGGPGSSAVWLNLGAFGPKQIVLNDLGVTPPPYNLNDNPYTLLDETDLVFIDPISTGYSRAAAGQDPKQFHGVEEDVKSVAEFIRLYTTRNNRWSSPKFLVGESYGATRACSLGVYLHDRLHYEINGIILISSILNYQTINEEEPGNDLSSLVFLPSFTAVAWYHQKLDPRLQKNLDTTLKEVEQFTLNEYAPALALGDLLEGDKKKGIIDKLSFYTALSPEFIEKSNLRICQPRFSKELLRDKSRLVGRFDARYLGIDPAICGEGPSYDPSLDALLGPFTAAFNSYARNDLKLEMDNEYVVLANVWPWDFGKDSFKSLNITENLKILLSKNPRLKIYVASGYFDLATPYFGTLFTFRHLALDPTLRKNIQMGFYPSGHMVYLHQPSLQKLKSELSQFMRSTINIP